MTATRQAGTKVPTGMDAGALSDGDVVWHAINWHQAHTTVRRLQARIVKATQEGRGGKVKALQRLLPHSFSGKVIAVKRVTENQGKHTRGGPRYLGHSGKEDGGSTRPATTGIPPQTAASGAHSEEQRQDA